MIRLITAPTSEPVTLAEAKSQCLVDHSDHDALIENYVTAAIEMVADRASLVLAPATYRVELAGFWSGLYSVLLAPVQEIGAIKYFDVDGDEQTIAASNYRWRRTDQGAEIWFLQAFTAPAVQAERLDAVTITVTAGFDDPNASGSGDDPEIAFPARARNAVLMLVDYWYGQRGAAAPVNMQSVPFGFDDLCGQLRVFR